MWNGMDGRRFPRANYKCAILIKRRLLSRNINTHTENIGIGGICVVLDRKLNSSEEVDLKLMLDNNLPAIECKGKVVWEVKRELPTKKVLYDIGIEFANIKEDNVSRIEKVVEDITKSSAKKVSGAKIRRTP
ncbi:MAG: hypothetical protein COS99_06330 [Candidatus Omnitrophica bacterium CG07_land_8_20_14_0_80_42_15]|uniref:PilZ domain-containing protein n=1 Tax=Candidatus Aquitaenariimonas noxiae TaxID=1974741 RepID=A0A2J0KU50_9BACT|nr:MAG: hypothetical protein COS99_06330 [Candidatus Omnitrophica bacterium CG07_land_8_20_14_0_80_42_15]